MSTEWTIGLATGLVIGSGLTWLIQRQQRRTRQRADARAKERKPLSTPQLLAWIDEATQGWLILKPDLSIAYINGKAERLLRISHQTLVRGQRLDEVLHVDPIHEAIVSVRHQQRPQRIE